MPLQIEVLCFLRMSHDEFETRFGVAAHEFGKDVLRIVLFAVGDFDAQESSRGGIEGRFEKRGGHHFAESFESGDLHVFDFFVILSQNVVAFFFVEHPVRFFPDIDAIERRLPEIDAAGFNERSHVTIEKSEQKRRDVAPVAVGVGEENDLVVAQMVERTILADGAAEGVCDIAKLSVLVNLVRARRFGVEDFAAQGEDGLNAAIASLFCRSAGGVAFDDEQLAFFRISG